MNARLISVRKNTGDNKDVFPLVIVYEQPELTGMCNCEFFCRTLGYFEEGRQLDPRNTPIEVPNCPCDSPTCYKKAK